MFSRFCIALISNGLNSLEELRSVAHVSARENKGHLEGPEHWKPKNEKLSGSVVKQNHTEKKQPTLKCRRKTDWPTRPKDERPEVVGGAVAPTPTGLKLPLRVGGGSWITYFLNQWRAWGPRSSTTKKYHPWFQIWGTLRWNLTPLFSQILRPFFGRALSAPLVQTRPRRALHLSENYVKICIYDSKRKVPK